MKAHITLGILALFTLFAGCSSVSKGPAYGHEQEFRNQIEASVPVQKWGYTIQDIRFTDDFKKALVVFTAGGKRHEVTFEDDGFRRYQGKVLDMDRQAPNVANTENWCQFVVVTLPDR